MFRNNKLESLEFCKDCVLWKASELKFKITDHSTKEKLVYIHYNLLGHAQVTSLSGCKYFLSFIDDFLRMS